MSPKLCPGATILSDYVIMCASVWIEFLALRLLDGVNICKTCVDRHVSHSHDSKCYDLFLIYVSERVPENTISTSTIRSYGPHSQYSSRGAALPYDSIFCGFYTLLPFEHLQNKLN